MNNWFSWNGVRCTDKGLWVTELPSPTIPAERVTFTNIPGRAGSLTTLEGEDVYDDLLLSATCIVSDPNRIPEIAAWLKGSGTVTFANRHGGFYYARIVNQISFEKILRGNPHRSFVVNFRCQPFWYHADVQPIEVTSTGTFIPNPGTIASEPVIKVTLSGDAEITIGGYLFSLSGVTGTVTIDTPRLECYQDYQSKNGCMSGDFPRIGTMGAYVNWAGAVSKIVIEPNWRSL